MCFAAGVALGGLYISSSSLLAQSRMLDYDQDVHPIFAARCIICHSAEKRSGGLSLAAYDDILNGGRSGPGVKPGHAPDSLLIERITGSSQPRMPLGLDPLSDAEIATIRTWIDQGARATPASAPAKAKWEAPLELTNPPVPRSPWKEWTGPIDRFTADYLAKHGVIRPVLVRDAEFARRAYLDIWGLLPAPDQLRDFLADKRPDKRSRLVQTLLADDARYAENWISYWNDLLRNDEGVAYYSETANRKTITPWLWNALKTNEPFDRWITQLLNPTMPGDPDGFLIGVNWRGTVSAAQTPAIQAAQNTAQIFLGINLKCNSCHDSFISRWKLKDAYGLATYFSSEEKLQLYRCDAPQNQYVSASFLYPQLNRTLPSESVADRRAVAAAIFTDSRNGRVPRTLVNRIWEKLLGRGIVENVDEMDGEPWDPELLDWLAGDFAANGYDLKHLIAGIVSSRTYQLASVALVGDPPKQFVFRGPEARRISAEQFADAVASITGDWHVAPSAIRSAVVGGAPASSGGLAIISGAPVDGAGRNPVARAGAAAAQPAAAARGGQGAQPAAPPPPIPAGYYAREWRIAGSNLTRAMGRPIRDQVYSTRDTQATMLQSLELVNGETLNHWLWRGARRMLGELPAEPKSLFSRQVSSGRTGGPPVPFDIDISKSTKLYLIVEDALSTAPDKAAPLWMAASLAGPAGTTPLSALTPAESRGLRQDDSPVIPIGAPAPVTDALRVKFPSVLVYDIAGKGFTRFRGEPALESVPLIQGEIVTARFFVFDQQPSMDRLVPPNPETPLPPGPVLATIPETIDRVYWYALGRAPSAAERKIAAAALQDPSHPGRPSADGLADLLWAILMTPEFQFIR